MADPSLSPESTTRSSGREIPGRGGSNHSGGARPPSAGGGARSVALEVGEDGEDAPVVVLRLVESELAKDVGGVLADGLLADEQLRGDRGVGEPLGHEPQHLLLAGGERV